MKQLAINITLITICILSLNGCTKEQALSDCSFESASTIPKSKLRKYDCETNTSCQWKNLCGKNESHYACCPKDPDQFPKQPFDICSSIID